MSRPGALSTDVARVDDIADDVIGFNVCLYIGRMAFLSTYFTDKGSCCSVSSDDRVVTDFYHRFDLLVQ